MRERLQKIISAAGLASRRAAETMILAGRVSVNGLCAALGDSADAETDVICVDGKPICVTEEKTYIMLHKPRGYVTTLSDEKGRPSVADLLKDLGRRVYPVGRLDMDSEGLLLMTDDGELANALMHPSHEIVKMYETTVSGAAMEQALPILRSAQEIDGYRIRPAQVEVLREESTACILRIGIHEGRNRQVRKMCEQAGLKVKRLCRVSEGPLLLGDLQPGKWRYLRKNEIDDLQKIISKGKIR